MSGRIDHKPGLKLRWIVAGILALALLAGLGFVLYHRESNRAKAERLLAELRAAGDPVSVHEVAALHNRFRTLTNPASALEEIFQNLPRQNTEPKSFGIRENRWPQPSEPLPTEAFQAMRAFVSTNSEVFRLMDEGINGALAVFDLQFADGANMVLPHLAKLKQTAQMLQLRAFVQIEGGQKAQAVQSVVRLLQLQHAAKADPLLICHLVRNASHQIALQALERLLVRHELEPEEIEQLQQALALAPTAEDFQRSLKGERAFGLTVFTNPASLPGTGPSMNKMKALPSWEYDRLQFLTHMTAAVNLATNNYPYVLREVDRLENDLQARVSAYRSNPVKQVFGFLYHASVLTDMLLPALFKAYQRQGEVLALTRLAGAALEIEKQGSSFARESAEEIASLFPKGEFMDPFSGKPLKLRRADGSVFLYSVGADEKDDGGARPAPREERRSRSTEGSDLVLQLR